jgi:hypothetical protein
MFNLHQVTFQRDPFVISPMNFAYFAWPLGRRFCRPLGRTLGILARQRGVALGTLATGASAMLLAPNSGFVRADDTELTEEERKTVELFKQCSGSVVHINTFVPGQKQFDGLPNVHKCT